MEVAIKVSAILDHNNILGSVAYNPIVNDPLNKITIKLRHTFQLPQGNIQTILLDEHDILNPKQEFKYNFLNPRYLEDLKLEVSFFFDSATVVQTVDVLDSEDTVDLSLPSNPIREAGSFSRDNPEFSENVPFDPPEEDIIIESEDITSEIFGLSELEILQAASRDDVGLYSEESISNSMLNPELNESIGGYFIDAPGFTQSLKYYNDGDKGVLRATVTNTSLVNAFSDVAIKSDLFSVNCGNGYVTLSTFYKHITAPQSGADAELILEYYNSRQQLISVDKKSFDVKENFDFTKEEATFTSMPSSTEFISWGIVFKNITDMNPLTVEITQPQFEHNSRSTTFTSGFRDFDAIRTSEICWKPDLFIKFKTLHSLSGLRGLVDTTVSGKDGFRWMASNNQLQFRVLDAVGATVLNILSNPLTKEFNEEVEYGISIELDYIRYYVDGVLHSEHQVSYPLFDFDGTAFVGRLEPAGAALNSKILGFGVYRSKPF